MCAITKSVRNQHQYQQCFKQGKVECVMTIAKCITEAVSRDC